MVMVMMWCLNIKKEQPKKGGEKKSFVLFGIKLSNEHMWNLPLNIIIVSP